MKLYALKRLLISIPLVFVMTFVVFIIINWTGATKFDSFENDPAVDPQMIEQEKRRLGIYEPIAIQYLYWLRGVLFDIRLTRERRFVAVFEDNDPGKSDDKYKFGGSEVRSNFAPACGTFAVAGGPAEKGQPVTLPGLNGNERVRRELDPRKIERIEIVATDPVPAGLAIVAVSGTGQTPFAFAPPKEGGPSRAVIDLNELQRVASLDQITEFRLTSTAPGTATITAASVKRRIWQETYAERHRRRTIQVPFSGTPGEYVQLGALKSPYTTRFVEGTDWRMDEADLRAKVEKANNAEWETWKAGGKKGDRPKGVKAEILKFEALEFEARAMEGAAIPVSVLLLHGDAAKPAATKIGEVVLGADEKTYEISLSSIDPSVDLRKVRGLRLASDARGQVEFDDFRLRVDHSPVRCGWPNFGQSWDKKQGVVSLIGEKVRNTIALSLLAIAVVWFIALPAGIYGAVRQYSTGDKIISFLTFVGMAMPSFFLAILVVLGVTLVNEIPKDSMFHFLAGKIPIAGRTSPEASEYSWIGRQLDILKHMILPALVGALGGIGGLQRVMRGTMLEERRKLYITTAQAKGLTSFAVNYKHALRNAIIPFVAGSGSMLPGLIGGSAFIEIIFDYPGVGRQMLESVTSYDIPVVMANTLIVGLLLVIGNLLADFGLAAVDPRISLEA